MDRRARWSGHSGNVAALFGAKVVLLWAATALVAAQVPGLPGSGKAEAPAAKGDEATPAPTLDNPEATVATTSGPIAVDEQVDDGRLQATLESLLPRYPGVRSVEIEVEDGVVTLNGHVEDEDVRTRLTEFVRRVEGVRLVLNRTRTDAQVLTGRELAAKTIAQFRELAARRWLLVLLALGVILAGLALARQFNRYSETLLAPFVGNVLLRSVLGSVLSTLIAVGGVLLGLTVLDLTEAVLSIVGLAGVVGLALGFAFRDIAENFIASVLLGVRRPFRVGDFVEVAGHAGVVKSLNTRATVLVTLDGKHVRIPNAIIFKEILLVATASPTIRQWFDVVVPYEVSTASALEAMTEALRSVDGVLPDPPARALLEALEPSGVRLRAYFWTPSRGIDAFKLLSAARLKVKVALQQAGIAPPPAGVQVTVAGKVPVAILGRDEARNGRQAATAVVARAGSAVTAEQASANLAHDARAAVAEPTADAGHANPMEHVLQEAESTVSGEGENLIREKD